MSSSLLPAALLALVVALVACTASETAAATADLHVAPTGSDDAAGTAAQPLASLRKAVEMARALKTDLPKRIVVHPGAYFGVAVTLGAADAGLTIEAAAGKAGEQPILYGGIPLTGWEKDGEKFYAAKLPAAADGKPWQVRVVQVSGQWRSRARFPAQGELTHESVFDVPWMSSTGGGWKRKPTREELTTLTYKAGDLGPWLNAKNAEVTVYHMWDESVAGVAAHDPDARTLKLAPALGHPPGAFGVKKYVLWNVREGMTAPGQWYHDRQNERIVYWPLPGEEMSQAQVIVPTTETIIRLRGAQAAPVRNVSIRGLTLAVTNAPLVTGGFGAAAFDGAVSLAFTDHCTLRDLTIAQAGGQGINTRGAATATRVENCEVSHCGAGGIYVGGENAVIASNHVHAVGLSYPSAIGIFRGGKHNTVTHNEVHDCPYTAINYGGEGNVIEYNLLYDCMKVLHDGAAIYLFAARDCVVRGNVARDILDTGGYGASAYYLDERSEGCVVERNLSVNVARPVHNHMTGPNTLRNNVFIVAGDAKLTFPRCRDLVLEGNVLYATGKVRIEGVNNVATWSKNLIHSAAGKLEGVNLKDYGTTGPANGPWGDTVTADPQFVDVAKGDYRYRDDSPARKLGLEAIDTGQAGREK